LTAARVRRPESARATLDLNAATYKQTVLTALQEVEDNLVAAVNLAQEEQVQTEALAAAQKSLTVANNQYQAGIVAYLNVLGPDDGAQRPEQPQQRQKPQADGREHLAQECGRALGAAGCGLRKE
jgi:outer membrane protein TolC